MVLLCPLTLFITLSRLPESWNSLVFFSTICHHMYLLKIKWNHLWIQIDYNIQCSSIQQIFISATIPCWASPDIQSSATSTSSLLDNISQHPWQLHAVTWLSSGQWICMEINYTTLRHGSPQTGLYESPFSSNLPVICRLGKREQPKGSQNYKM